MDVVLSSLHSHHDVGLEAFYFFALIEHNDCRYYYDLVLYLHLRLCRDVYSYVVTLGYILYPRNAVLFVKVRVEFYDTDTVKLRLDGYRCQE